MADRLQGKRIAILATTGVEKEELTSPHDAVIAEGAEVDLVSLEEGQFQSHDHLEPSDEFTADRAVGDASAEDYDGLILPGGVANPDFLRADEDAVAFVRAFARAGKPIAAICHGPWMLVEADLVRGRKVTSYPSIKTDVENAGGEWVDEEVAVDDGIVTSRRPDDLEAFNAKAIEEFCEGRHEQLAAGTTNGARAS